MTLVIKAQIQKFLVTSSQSVIVNRFKANRYQMHVGGKLRSIINGVRLNFRYKGRFASQVQAEVLYNILTSVPDLKESLKKLSSDGDLSQFLFNYDNFLDRKVDFVKVDLSELKYYDGLTIYEIYTDVDELERFLFFFSVVAYNCIGDYTFPIYDETHRLYHLIANYYNLSRSILQDGDFKQFVDDYKIVQSIGASTNSIVPMTVLRHYLMAYSCLSEDDIFAESQKEIKTYTDKPSKEACKWACNIIIVLKEFLEKNGENIDSYIAPFFVKGEKVKRIVDKLGAYDYYEVQGYEREKVIIQNKGRGVNSHCDEEELEIEEQ